MSTKNENNNNYKLFLIINSFISGIVTKAYYRVYSTSSTKSNEAPNCKEKFHPSKGNLLEFNPNYCQQISNKEALIRNQKQEVFKILI